jgi:hypothetical protein
MWFRHDGDIRHQAVRQDNLMRGIDRDLAAVALDEVVAGRQDPAVRIGEVLADLEAVHETGVVGRAQATRLM